MSEPNITRLERDGNGAWWVRFQRGLDQEGKRLVWSKHFSDGLYGDKRKSLRAARQWRDIQQALVPPRLREQGRKPAGHGYVRRTELMRRAEAHPCYVAWIRLPDGKAAQTSRSVRVWGERGAKIECERWLRRQRRALGKRHLKEHE